jgi:hypothetical protein
MVVLPPSTGKEVSYQEVDHANQLSELGQDLIDAIAHHNGRQPPRPAPVQPEAQVHGGEASLTDLKLALLLSYLDPGMGYEDWMRVMMATFHATGGNAEGLQVFADWSAKSPKYSGLKELEYKWNSLKGYSGQPVTINSIYWMLEAQGVDWKEVLAGAEPAFTAIGPTEVVELGVKGKTLDPVEVMAAPISATEGGIVPASNAEQGANGHALATFSLKGKLEVLLREARAEVFVLAPLALQGQFTVIYSASNRGKTLLTHKLLLKSCKIESFKPEQVYYINADDNHNGLIAKLEIAEEHG